MLNLVNFGFVVWTKIGELHEPASTSNACPRDVRVTRCDMSAPETEPEVRTREDLNKFLRARTREGSPGQVKQAGSCAGVLNLVFSLAWNCWPEGGWDSLGIAIRGEFMHPDGFAQDDDS